MDPRQEGGGQGCPSEYRRKIDTPTFSGRVKSSPTVVDGVNSRSAAVDPVQKGGGALDPTRKGWGGAVSARCCRAALTPTLLHRVTFGRGYTDSREGRMRNSRPLLCDLAYPATSIVVATDQYFSGLVRGRPALMRIIWQHAGHNSFREWCEARPE